MAQMIFVPMTRDEVVALRLGAAGARDHFGCAATPSLVAAMDPETVTEEAEYAALSNAGVLALVLKPEAPRLVVAAEVRPDQITDLREPSGEIEVHGLTWAQVQALFADEPAAWEAVRLASDAVAGASLAAALDTPEVAALLDAYDLLWYAPDELDQL
jgi:Family of unknown function (DUF6912)